MTAILLITIAAIAFWALGGVALRWGGVAAVALGLSVALGVDTGVGLLLVVTGAVAWLAGHVHYRLRHGEYKSRLGAAVLRRA